MVDWYFSSVPWHWFMQTVVFHCCCWGVYRMRLVHPVLLWTLHRWSPPNANESQPRQPHNDDGKEMHNRKRISFFSESERANTQKALQLKTFQTFYFRTISVEAFLQGGIKIQWNMRTKYLKFFKEFYMEPTIKMFDHLKTKLWTKEIKGLNSLTKW